MRLYGGETSPKGGPPDKAGDEDREAVVDVELGADLPEAPPEDVLSHEVGFAFETREEVDQSTRLHQREPAEGNAGATQSPTKAAKTGASPIRPT